MFSINKTKLFIVIVTLVIAGLVISFQPENNRTEFKQGLKEALLDIPDWQRHPEVPIEMEIVTALDLDDYTNTSFSKGDNQISLYIGYYNTAKKVGAAHDPTVCFPGQGWILSGKLVETYKLKGSGEFTIPYSMMTAQKGDDNKVLIIYWFQSHDIANSNTFTQKLTLIWNRLLHRGESNAFIRVITPLAGKTEAECKEIILDFITKFYPVYIAHITQDN